VDINELKQGRKAFTKEEWMDVLLRSIGMEPDTLTECEKWLLLARMIPLVENNFNLCELGPRSTGKSHLYKEISPNSILVSGGQTTVANLFGKLALPTLIALCSIALNKPTLSSMAVLGEISISGTMIKVDELANALQVCLDSGAKKVLLSITSAADLGTVPADLISCFNLIFYSSAEDAVFKALGVE